MILAVDVHYTSNHATAGGVVFHRWKDPVPDKEYTSVSTGIDIYEPGSFYKRELPCILKLLNEHNLEPNCIVIDGFVFLDGSTLPGFGKHLYDILQGSIPIIGVAKTAFKGIPPVCKIFRGTSSKPLYVTVVGWPLETAKQRIRSMRGKHRIPDLLKRADRLCRGMQG